MAYQREFRMEYGAAMAQAFGTSIGSSVEGGVGSLVSTVRVTPGLWNIAVAVVSILLPVTFVCYAILENFTYH